MKSDHTIKMKRFSFAAQLTPDEKDGGFIVTFRDLPEAITQGDSLKEALAEASDCLEEAIAARIDDRLEIPLPSQRQESEHLITVPIQTALKATLELARREAGISKVELARTLNLNEKEVRRMLDPRHGTKLPTIERALSALGKQVEINLI